MYQPRARGSAILQKASATPLLLRQIPIWKKGIAMGFIDLALERAFIYREHAPSEMINMNEGDQERELEARYEMLETLSDHDDVLMEHLLEDMEPPKDQIFDDLIEEMRQGLVVPVLIGAAEHENGIKRILKALRHEGPGIGTTVKRLACPEVEAGDAIVQIMKSIHTSHGANCRFRACSRAR